MILIIWIIWKTHASVPHSHVHNTPRCHPHPRPHPGPTQVLSLPTASPHQPPEYRPVYFFGHRDAATTAPYVTLALASGAAVKMTARHFLPVCTAGCTQDSLAGGTAVFEQRWAAPGSVHCGGRSNDDLGLPVSTAQHITAHILTKAWAWGLPLLHTTQLASQPREQPYSALQTSLAESQPGWVGPTLSPDTHPGPPPLWEPSMQICQRRGSRGHGPCQPPHRQRHLPHQRLAVRGGGLQRHVGAGPLQPLRQGECRAHSGTHA